MTVEQCDRFKKIRLSWRLRGRDLCAVFSLWRRRPGGEWYRARRRRLTVPVAELALLSQAISVARQSFHEEPGG